MLTAALHSSLASIGAQAIITVGFSVLALLISIYGVWERRTGARRHLLERLGEVVDEINQVGLDQDAKARETGRMDPGLAASFNARREFLAREAVRLVELLTRPEGLSRRAASPSKVDIPDSQYRFLAHALRRVGEWGKAREYFEAAISAAPDHTAFKIFALRGYAGFLYATGETDEATATYATALRLIDIRDDYGLYLAGQTEALWGRDAQSAGLEGDSHFSAARAHFQKLRNQGLRDEQMSAVDILAMRRDEAHLRGSDAFDQRDTEPH